MDWGTVEMVHVFGPEVVPGSSYEIQVIGQSCATAMDNESNYSGPVTVRTAQWGDVCEPFSTDPEGSVQPDFSDIACLVDKFIGDPNAPIKARAQLQPQVVRPNSPIDFGDIAAAVDAFTGGDYPYPAPTVCP